MRAVIQRANGASVAVDGRVTASFSGEGLLVLVGVGHSDGEDQAQRIARKVAELRLLRGERSVSDAGAPVIVVSQFTLLGEARKGRRPTWNAAAPGPVAEPLVARVVALLRDRGLTVGEGVFGADMAVQLTNDGPVTLIVDAN
ncbi:MAG: D-tyrosyl-tRNA(Tyr) deacylase [Bifidobacteriaceae bacterium]|jgi:D-tyrosyl-tRNA(Tyr) deacylase|nr:D-tyrosyl-tRNA(Tyr) deacylase [Bifidobacteriaceae bacterium]